MVNRRSFARQIVGCLPVYVASSVSATAWAQQAGTQYPPGRGPFDGSPVGDPLPGQRWRVHDHSRPQPRKVTPGTPIPSPAAPSDAIVLFDGRDLSKWNGVSFGRGGAGPVTEPRWSTVDGHAEMRGGIVTKESFGDIQLHLEWTTPPVQDPIRVGQQRGNSGVIFMGRYEVQVLSSYDNPTYADGGAGAMYGVYPPMVNPCLPEGQWNSFDFAFEAPRFEGEKLVKPAFLTLFFNGVLVHHHAQFLGSTSHEPLAAYSPHPPELPFALQGHIGPAWYRNIWVRRIRGYDA